MPAIVNVRDFVVIGVIALAFIFLFNRGLGALGLDSFQA